MSYIHIEDNSTKSINWQVSYNPSGFRNDGRFQIWLIFSLVGTQWRILLVSSKIMPASKLAAQHSPCTLLQRLPSRDNSSKRVKLLRLMGSPFSLHPIPRHALLWEILDSGAEWDMLLRERGNSVISSDSQLPTNHWSLVANHGSTSSTSSLTDGPWVYRRAPTKQIEWSFVYKSLFLRD